ncbi:mannitol dehydrogenase family protein [Erysipelotrichaceae bacterium RD49]|nr:mannitol dehydrogenase family protein [Erysipelotrichaceae bacterium RD49]
MKLSNEGLKDRALWESKGYSIPEYDRQEMIVATKNAPVWIHFGAGNLFKAYQANLMNTLLNNGKIDKGVIAVEGFDKGIIDASRAHDDYALLATLKSDGSIDKTVIGSIAEVVFLDPKDESIVNIFANPSLQMASFTITEKGYALSNAAGEYLPAVEADFTRKPEDAESYLGKVTALLYDRFKKNGAPIAMVSMDNCSHNGEKLKDAMMTYVDNWVKNGVAEPEFREYVTNEEKVTFPWTMIDKITPRPDKTVEELLAADGLEDLEPVKTPRGSFVAPFVNAEETEYLVIEDKFPNGRPNLEDAGVIFTDRDTVNKVEKMKVTTCLNPLHTSLAVFGCLLDYKLISEEMKNPDLVDMIKIIGYDEGLPVVVNPGILDPKDFIDTVINVRFGNPFMPDSPQRIATDTSQKLSVRFGETIKSYVAEGLDLGKLSLIPMVQAGWIRYIMGIDDNGNEFEVSADPLLEEVRPVVADIKLGDQVTEEKLRPILSNQKIYGVDLYALGLADRIVALFNRMIAGKGAVAKTIHEEVEAAKAANQE